MKINLALLLLAGAAGVALSRRTQTTGQTAPRPDLGVGLPNQPKPGPVWDPPAKSPN